MIKYSVGSINGISSTSTGDITLSLGDLAGTSDALLDKVVKKQNTFYIPENYNFSLLSSVTQKNIVVSYTHDLATLTTNFGSNKNIFFEGGIISNGTVSGTSCQIIADKVKILATDITFTGTWLNDIYPEWFGDRSTSGYDWQPALQKSLDFAKLTSGKVSLSAYTYTYYNQLTVDAGVTMEGISRGETALGAGATKGSVLLCLGNSLGSLTYDNIAIKVIGRMVNFRNFTIKGQRSLPRYGTGIEIYGVGDGVSSQALIENCSFDNLIIHGFMKGAGLRLVAGNSGAVTYCNFNNIRTRDCAQHLHIKALSQNPIYNNLGSTGLPYSNINCFINSNNFNGLYMSGYCETGLYVYTEYDAILTNSQKVFRPANNLTFNGVVIEPPYSTNSHIRIEGGGSIVKMYDIRVEALNQNVAYSTVPVIYLDSNTINNTIDFDQASVPIVDLGKGNYISSTNTKNANPSPNSGNMYKNSSLIGLNKLGTDVILPDWQLQEQSIDVNNTFAWQNLKSNSIVTIEESSEIVVEGYKVLTVTVPPQRMFRLNQGIDRAVNNIPNGRVHCKVKTGNAQDVIWTYQDNVTPLLSGGASFGGNTWENIGGWFPITPLDIATGYYRFALFCQNYTNSNIVFSFTMPSFVTGKETPNLPAKLITEQGGTYYGTVGYNVVKNIRPVTNPSHNGGTSSDVILPKDGNYFEINEGNLSIQRINFTTDRFKAGDIITLHFNYAGVIITFVNSFIAILKPFVSDIGSTITLQTIDGNGLWKEISRTDKKETGWFYGDILPVISTNFLNLDKKYNLFTLSNTTNASLTINRINESSRFEEGRQITLTFETTDGLISITNNAYLILSLPIVYFPKNGDWIKFETAGNGVWYEIARKAIPLKIAYNGYAIVDATANTSTNYLTLPTTGHRYFSLNNSGGSQLIINRINNDLSTRFEEGSEVFLKFDTLTNPITLSNSAYITLTYNRLYTPITGDWIKLITKGDGTWTEVSRKESTLLKQYRGVSTIESSTATVTNFLTLPTTGENFFNLNNVSGAGVTINRINNDAAVRFEAGSEIIIKFGTLTNAIAVGNSAYITLLYSGSYAPVTGDWMKLATDGNGTWTEIARKPSSTYPLLLSITLSASYLSGGFLTLPLTGENYFSLSAATLGGSITRINNASGSRFGGGKIIMIEFTNITNAVTLVHSAYLTLTGATNYTPALNGGIMLYTRGDGTWREMSRF